MGHSYSLATGLTKARVVRGAGAADWSMWAQRTWLSAWWPTQDPLRSYKMTDESPQDKCAVYMFSLPEGHARLRWRCLRGNVMPISVNRRWSIKRLDLRL